MGADAMTLTGRVLRTRHRCDWGNFVETSQGKVQKPTPFREPARKQAVIYARVSSKNQEKEGFSRR